MEAELSAAADPAVQRTPFVDLDALRATVVGLIRESCGRGPAACSLVLVGNEVVITSLGGLTRAERRLRDGGHRDVAVVTRRALQEHVDDRLANHLRQTMGASRPAVASTIDVDAERVTTVVYLDEAAQRPL